MTKKRSFNKLAATSIAAAAAVAAVAPVAVAADTKSFPDVNAGDTHYNGITALTAQGIIKGYADGSFGTYDNVTRQQVAVMLSIALDLKTPTDVKGALAGYKDVDENHQYAKQIAAVTAAGIFKGSGGVFGAGDDITREQMATTLVLGFGLADLSAKHVDINLDNVDPSHAARVQVLADLAITNQTDDFRPKESITRGAFSTQLFLTQEAVSNEDIEEELVVESTVVTDSTTLSVTLSDKTEHTVTLKEALVPNTATEVTFTIDDKEYIETVTFEKAIVKSVSKIADIVVTEGEAVKLPKTVEVTYEDKTTANVDVTWNDADFDLSKADTYILTGTIEGTNITAGVNVVVEAVVPEVASVEAINATQVEFKFNTKVDKDSAETETYYTFSELDGQSPAATVGTDAVLQADGKTVLLTVDEPLAKRYQVKTTSILAEDGTTAIGNYDAIINFAADTVAPTVTGYEQINATEVKIKFSEPMDVLAHTNISFKDSEGNVLVKAGTPTNADDVNEAAIVKGEDFVIVNLDKVAVGKKVSVTIANAKDLAGNLITPQPSTIVVEKKELGTFAPTISSVVQTGAKKFTVKFSEALDGKLVFGDVSVDPTNATNAIKKVSDSEYEVTVDDNLIGLSTVKIDKTKIKNKLGQAAGTTGTLDKLIAFKIDTVAPQATTAKLASDKNNQQVIELTFDKDVKLIAGGTDGLAGDVTLEGTQVKDFTTTDVAAVDATAVYADGKGDNKKVIHIPLIGTGLTVEDAAYDLTIVNKTANTEGIISDADVAMKTVEAKYTKGANGTPPTQPNKDKFATVRPSVVNNDEITVTFDKDVDPATATNIANYKIDNAVIESATVSSGNAKVVTLKLKKNSSAFNGDRNLTVQNVKVKDSSVTDTYTRVITAVIENVRPTIEKAEVIAAGVITLTFSEAINSTFSIDAFVVKAGTVALDLDGTDGAKIDTDNPKKINIKLDSALGATELAQTITVEPSSTTGSFDVEDLNGNKLEAFSPITVIKP